MLTAVGRERLSSHVMNAAPDLKSEYQENGYISNVRIFSDEEIAEFRARFDKLESELGKETCQTGLLDWHLKEQFIWDLSTGSRLLDVMSQLLGEGVLLNATHFFCKYPDKDNSAYVAWHQDVTYWGFDPPEALTAWIALDDADKENGAMVVYPGSHRMGQLYHGEAKQEGNLLPRNQEVDEAFIDQSKVRQLSLKAGEMSVHDGLLLHASMPNGSERRRCGLTVRFIAPSVRQAVAGPQGQWYRPILVRGEDKFGHFPETPKPFPLK